MVISKYRIVGGGDFQLNTSFGGGVIFVGEENGLTTLESSGNGAVNINAGTAGGGNGTLALRTAGTITLDAAAFSVPNAPLPSSGTTATDVNSFNADLTLTNDINANVFFEVNDGGTNYINLPCMDTSGSVRHKFLIEIAAAGSEAVFRGWNTDSGAVVQNKISWVVPWSLALGRVDHDGVGIECNASGNAAYVSVDVFEYNNGVGVANEFMITISGYQGDAPTINAYN